MPNADFSEANGNAFVDKGTRNDNDVVGSVTLKKEISTKLEELGEVLEKSTAGSRKPMVREYSFNINTGVVEYLELDSFGISIVPATLVSTYCLFVENVIEVALDTVVVHETAVSQVRQLTKGICDSQKVESFGNTFGDYPDFKSETRSPRSQNRQKNKRSQKFSSGTRDDADIWDLPMDY